MNIGTQQSNIAQRPAAIRREDLTPECRIQTRGGRNRTKASVTRYRLEAGDVAVKDYADCGGWRAASYGRWLIGREVRAYVLAEGCPGIPRFLGRVDHHALALEWVDARPLASFQPGEVERDCFHRLRSTLEDLHERGIALTDLNHSDVLIADNGQVTIVDLATSWLRDLAPRLLHRRLFRHFTGSDLFALARLEQRYCGGDLEQLLRATDPEVVRWHRRARRLKWRWDKLRGASRLPPLDDHWR